MTWTSYACGVCDGTAAEFISLTYIYNCLGTDVRDEVLTSSLPLIVGRSVPRLWRINKPLAAVSIAGSTPYNISLQKLTRAVPC